LNVLWCDDLVVPVVVHADDLLKKSRAAFIVIWNVFTMFGLMLNMLPGKTALLPAFNGKRSEHARRAFAALPNSTLLCTCRGDNVIGLPIANIYTHMGCRTVANASLLPEIACRHSTAQPVLRRLRTKFFRNTRVAIADKVNVASALMLSRELYGSGGYPTLTTAERERIHANMVAIYRTACGERFDCGDEMLSDVALLNVYSLRSPYASVRFSRLRLSVRLATRASFGLLTLIHASRSDSRSWIQGLCSDLKWMKLCDRECSYTVAEWFCFCRTEPKKARSLIRKICASPEATSVTLSEQSSAVKALQGSYSCPCGCVLIVDRRILLSILPIIMPRPINALHVW
jgi:hypothetical protein